MTMKQLMKIESWRPVEEKQGYKLVRTDSYTDILGQIIMADEDTGECAISVGDETKHLAFGPHGLRIVPRSRSELAALSAPSGTRQPRD